MQHYLIIPDFKFFLGWVGTSFYFLDAHGMGHIWQKNGAQSTHWH